MHIPSPQPSLANPSTSSYSFHHSLTAPLCPAAFQLSCNCITYSHASSFHAPSSRMHCLKCPHLCPSTFLTSCCPISITPALFQHSHPLPTQECRVINPLTSSHSQVTPPLTLSLLSMISHAYQAWAPPPCHLPIVLVASSTDIGCSGPRMKRTDGAPVSEIRTLGWGEEGDCPLHL